MLVLWLRSFSFFDFANAFNCLKVCVFFCIYLGRVVVGAAQSVILWSSVWCQCVPPAVNTNVCTSSMIVQCAPMFLNVHQSVSKCASMCLNLHQWNVHQCTLMCTSVGAPQSAGWDTKAGSGGQILTERSCRLPNQQRTTHHCQTHKLLLCPHKMLSIMKSKHHNPC